MPQAPDPRPVEEPVEPEALVASYLLDPGTDGQPYTAVIHLTGRRAGVSGRPTKSDSFEHDEIVAGILPGSGPMSVTSWVYGLTPGEWSVSATVSRQADQASEPRPSRTRSSAEAVSPVTWSWRRRSLGPGQGGLVKTRWALIAPLARMPGVVPGSWFVLWLLGTIVALSVLAILADTSGMSVAAFLSVAVIASIAGLIAAKLWYAVLHPEPTWKKALLGGWAVDGFFVVAAITGVVLSLALAVPVGAFLDTATPGLFFAVAIARLGCFFTGCCAGRCTTSRWGIWSSDRRVGARRIPAQLIESLIGLVIALVSLALYLIDPGVDGLIFLVAVIPYAIARQLILRIRAERREFSWRRRRNEPAGSSS